MVFIKSKYIASFDFLSDWVSECKTEVMVAEKEDIEKALVVAMDAQLMLERGIINDKGFLRDYTTITSDDKHFQLNSIDFPIQFSVASTLKYEAKYLLIILISELNKELDSPNVIKIVINPK